MKLEQVMQCCAFSARNNEMGHSSQLLGLADLDGVHARGVKGAQMGLDGTLEVAVGLGALRGRRVRRNFVFFRAATGCSGRVYTRFEGGGC